MLDEDLEEKVAEARDASSRFPSASPADTSDSSPPRMPL
jgi:hypothetical protein